MESGGLELKGMVGGAIRPAVGDGEGGGADEEGKYGKMPQGR